MVPGHPGVFELIATTLGETRPAEKAVSTASKTAAPGVIRSGRSVNSRHDVARRAATEEPL
jgi:hypothetical protein